MCSPSMSGHLGHLGSKLGYLDHGIKNTWLKNNDSEMVQVKAVCVLYISFGKGSAGASNGNYVGLNLDFSLSLMDRLWMFLISFLRG